MGAVPASSASTAVSRTPPPTPRPFLARLTAPPGPAVSCLVERDGASVLVVPGLYSVSYVLIGPDDVAVVDVGSITDVKRVRRALAWLGRTERVRSVLPTHLHMDHAMGIDALARSCGAEVALGGVAHEAVTQGRKLRFPRGLNLLRTIPTWFMQGAPLGTLADLRGGLGFGFPWARNRFKAPLGDALLDGTPLPGLPGWVALATPGHADDALCLYHAEARFLIAGDTIRNFLGGEWNRLLCDPAAYAQTRERLATLDVRTVFPGHGPVFDVTEVAAIPTRARFLP